MRNFANIRKKIAGFSIIEIMVVLVIASIILSGMFYIFNRSGRQLRTQSMVADIQSVGSIAFFLIGRDLRRAGSNPNGALGYNVGAPIPFGYAEPQRIRIFADLNGDKDVSDDEEDVIYDYIDTDSNIDGNDTLRRTSGANITYISNVYDFHMGYIISNGFETDAPSPLSDIRMIRLTFEIGTDQRDPQTGKIITKTFETTIGLRNYQ